jgi:hypothetical protein
MVIKQRETGKEIEQRNKTRTKLLNGS